MLQRLASWMLMLLGLALVGCGSTNTVLDATSLYTRGENQSALDVLSEAKSNSKNQQWAPLQEVTVALDASQFERAARAVSWVEARDELIDERALISGTEVKEDLGSALIGFWFQFGRLLYIFGTISCGFGRNSEGKR